MTSTTQQEREAFEAAVRERFTVSEYSFSRAYAEGYYNTVTSNTYQGHRAPEYAAVSMLWEVWQAARAALPQRDEPVAEGKAGEEIHLAWRGALKACGVSEADRDAIGEVVLSMLNETTPPSPSLREVQADAWISVDDRLPDSEEQVLVWTSSRHGMLDRWRMQSEAPLSFSSATVETGMYWDEHEFEDITHWMPLPKAPELARLEGGK